MRGHPDDETIAAFREDLLPARRAARIAAHLAECPRCVEVDAQLAAVTAALARTPAPPMPASLTARLDAALAAEVAARSAASASPAHADSAEGAALAGPAAAGPADRTAAADRTASPATHAHPGPGTGPEHTGPGHVGPGHAGPGHTGPGRGGPGRRAGRPRAGSRLSLRIASVTAAVVVLAGGGYAIARVVSGGQELFNQFLRRRRIRQRGEPAIRISARPRGSAARPHRRAPAGRQRHDLPGRPAAGPGGRRAQAPPRPRSRQRGPARGGGGGRLPPPGRVREPRRRWPAPTAC